MYVCMHACKYFKYTRMHKCMKVYVSTYVCTCACSLSD